MYTTRVKMAKYKIYFKPSLTYASETWTYSKKELSRIQATEMKFLHGMVHKTRSGRKRNDKIRGTLNAEKLTTVIEENRFKRFGHLKKNGKGLNTTKNVTSQRLPTFNILESSCRRI